MSNIIKDYLDWYICWPKTLKLKSSTFYMYYSQIFTDQTARNFLEKKSACVLIHLYIVTKKRKLGG